jgi:molybdenum cofactor cytidylyltransferase
MPDSTVALIILSAGRSSRMGESKALLRFGNWTALELIVRSAAAAGVGRVVAVIGHRAEEIRAAHSFTGVGIDFSWAMNRSIESEQIESLRMGLRALEAESLEAFFFHPVDHPLVTRSDFMALLEAHRAHAGPEMAFIAAHGQRRGHPVLCRGGMREVFLHLAPGKTARDALEEGGMVEVEVPNAGVLEDMDTREDYRRLREVFRQRSVGPGPGATRGRLPPTGAAPA